MAGTREHAFITMSDGVHLAATLYMPEGDGPWPAILEALPYRKDDVTASYRSEYERLRDEGGYVVARVDVRGTGSSEGVAEDEYPPSELRDMNEVISWLASQEWSTGAVGMYGTSYSAFNSIQVATTRPPALKAIVAIYGTDDRYGDDVHYFGGALKALDLIDYPTYTVAENALPPVPSIYGEGWREEWERRVERNEPWVIRWFEHQVHDDYWQAGSLRPDYDRIEAATMLIGGWADGYRNNSLRTMAGLRCPKRLLMGPWSHMAADSSLPGPRIDHVAEMLRWWDRWLKDVDNGVDREPPIAVFVRRSTRPEPDLDEVRGEWRFENGWPLERGREVPHPLAGATPLWNDVDATSDALEVRGDVGVQAWISCAAAMPYGQPLDQRPDEAYSLVYDWGPVESELEILGHPRLEVMITSTAPVAYLSAKLCDVFPDGTSALVTRGMLNLAQREDRDHPRPIEPGVPARVSIELEATSWVFEPGHRIRLDLAGSDWPNAWPPPEPVTLTVQRSDAALVLPVVDGPEPIAERPRFRPPGEAPGKHDPLDASTPQDGGVVWKSEYDILGRETRATAGSWSSSDLEGGARILEERYMGTVGASAADPGNAWMQAEAIYRIAWPEVTAETHVRGRLDSDAREYRLALELDVKENGEIRWQRRWERAFPRHLQ